MVTCWPGIREDMKNKQNNKTANGSQSSGLVVRPHPRDKHYARCGFCGWVGKEIELPGDTHECGKDECPKCGKEYFITCCLRHKDVV